MCLGARNVQLWWFSLSGFCEILKTHNYGMDRFPNSQSRYWINYSNVATMLPTDLSSELKIEDSPHILIPNFRYHTSSDTEDF